MKKLFIMLLMFFAFAMIAFPVFAQSRQKIVIVPQNQTINHDLIVPGNTVTVSGTVNGDVYAAGGNVTINGSVNGDVIAAGGNVTIAGTVKNDVRVAGGDITFSGATVGGNITTLGGQILIDPATKISGSIVGAGGNFNILGPIGKGANLAGGNVIIDSSIGGDVAAAVGNLTLEPRSQINGSLSYWSNNKAVVQGQVANGIHQYQPTNRPNPQRAAAQILRGVLFFKFADVLVLLIIGLLITWLLPIYANNGTDYITTHFWRSVLIGLAAVIVVPIVIILLMLTVIGIPLALFFLIVYLFVLWFSRIFALVAIGKFILQKSSKRPALVWSYLLGIVIYFVLQFIPVVSFLTHLFVGLAGLGAFVALKQNYYTTLREKKVI